MLKTLKKKFSFLILNSSGLTITNKFCEMQFIALKQKLYISDSVQKL